MPLTDLERGLSPSDKEEAYLNFVMDGYHRSLKHHQAFRSATMGWYDLFRGYWSGRNDPGWNNIHIPVAMAVTLSDAARLMQILRGAQAATQFLPTGPEDQASARRAERLVDQQFYNTNFDRKLARSLQRSGIYGTAILRDGWKTRYGPISKRMGVDNARGGTVKGNFPTSVKFNGPDLEEVGILKWLPFPGYLDIEDMPGCWHEYELEFEDIELGADDQDGRNPIYDKSVVEKMRREGPNPRGTRDAAFRRSFASSEDTTWAKIRMFDRPVSIVEYHGRVPRQLGAWYSLETGIAGASAEEAGPGAEYFTDFVVTVADEKWVLRAVPNPDATGQKPFYKVSPFDDAEEFYSMGKIETVAKMNVAMNRLINNQLDAQDRWIDPPWVINVNSVLNPGNMHAGPGARIWTEGPTTDSDMRQMHPDTRWTDRAFDNSNHMWGWAQRATGTLEDLGIGAQGAGRESATGVAARSDAVSSRLAMEAIGIEKSAIEPIAYHFWNMSRQFLPSPQFISAIGAHAVMNPVTGRFNPPDMDILTHIDMAKDFNVRATGATRQLSKSARQQSLAAFLPAVTAFMPAINQLAFMRQVLPIMDFTNVDELVNSEAEYLRALTLGVGPKDNNQSRREDGPRGGVGTAASDPIANIRHLLQPGEEPVNIPSP